MSPKVKHMFVIEMVNFGVTLKFFNTNTTMLYCIYGGIFLTSKLLILVCLVTKYYIDYFHFMG